MKDSMGSTDLRGKKKTKGSSQREAQVIQRRESLIEASLKVIEKQGLTGITIGSIAKEAGCSYGVVAFHFKSKDGIIFAALDALAAEYAASLERTSSDRETPAQSIRKMIENDFSSKATNKKKVTVWVSFWAEAARVPSFRQKCSDFKQYYNETLERDIKELAAKRGVHVNAKRLARSLNAMIDGYWIANLLKSKTGPADAEEARGACMAFMRAYFPQDF